MCGYFIKKYFLTKSFKSIVAKSFEMIKWHTIAIKVKGLQKFEGGEFGTAPSCSSYSVIWQSSLFLQKQSQPSNCSLKVHEWHQLDRVLLR